LIAVDEQNVFSHVAAYWSHEGHAILAKDVIPDIVIDGPQPLPTYVVLARRARSAPEAEFAAYVLELADALGSYGEVARAAAYVFEPYDDSWESPNVTHSEAGVEIHGRIEVTFTSLDAVRVLTSASFTGCLSRASGLVAAMHPYHQYEAYTFRLNGRPTLIGLRGYEPMRTATSMGALNQLSTNVVEITSGYRPGADG
jgi:hypothetical protein